MYFSTNINLNHYMNILKSIKGYIVKNQTILIIHCGKPNYFINSILMINEFMANIL